MIEASSNKSRGSRQKKKKRKKGEHEKKKAAAGEKGLFVRTCLEGSNRV